jgi:hypothetical protein
MHWFIPTMTEDARQGGAWWTTACLADAAPGRTTENPKKITCKRCKAIYANPHTPAIMAARLWQHVTSLQEQNEWVMIKVECERCESDVDVSEMLYGDTLASLEKFNHLLEHCAFEHMGGADLQVSRVETWATSYEVNYGMRKDAMTEHEQKWRDRMELRPIR